MRPRIRKPGANIRDVLRLATTPEQREMVVALLQRYGAKNVVQLHPEQVVLFLEELIAVLNGEAPHPADSVLDPTMMEIR